MAPSHLLAQRDTGAHSTMTSRSRLILVTLSLGAAAISAFLAASGLSVGASVPVAPNGMSQAELQALDTTARNDIVEVKGSIRFHGRFPPGLPAGYYYTHVVFERGHPEQGFAIWMQEANASDRGIHIIEAPEVPNAAKDTLNLPNLVPVPLRNGTWMTMQKPDDPWRGLWIYAIVLDGVHIEVDGADRTLVQSVAASL